MLFAFSNLQGEIQKVLNLNVLPTRIIYANPCKQKSMLNYAAKHNVAMMTFDNEAELYKVKSLYPTAKYEIIISMKLIISNHLLYL